MEVAVAVVVTGVIAFLNGLHIGYSGRDADFADAAISADPPAWWKRELLKAEHRKALAEMEGR